MKRIQGTSAAITSIMVGALSAGCSGGGGDDGGTGTLSLAIMDGPVEDVAQVWVEFTGVSLKPQGNGPPIRIDFPQPVKRDLLTLTPDNAETLLDAHTLPAGFYNWLELHVNASFDGSMDSYAVSQIGGMEEIEVEIPSGGLRLVSGLTITADQETSFLIDWDLRTGLTEPVGRDGYILKPALRVIDMTEYGIVRGTVATALVSAADCTNDLNLDIGNAVYVYSGLAAIPDDIDGTDPDPVATARVAQNESGAYVYELILSPGEYTFAFTCQASGDLALTDEAIGFVASSAGVTVADGAELTVDF